MADAGEGQDLAGALPPVPGPEELEAAAGASVSGNGSTAEAEEVAPVPPGQSKKSRKRLQRLEMWKQQKAAKKEAKRAARAQARAERGPAPARRPPPETEEELAAAQQRREERLVKRQEERAAFVEACGKGARIVIDCGFDAELTEKELKSLAQQLMHLYSSNKKAAEPSTVVLTELGPRLRKMLENVTGIEEWLGFHMETASYLDLCPPKEKLVYLTSDSPTTLAAWDRSATYIIGGIVDRNRLKGATFLKAQRQGIATARFPLQEHVKLGASPVLTVNHVFDILLEYQHSGDWAHAFKTVIPPRKLYKPPPNRNQAGAPAAAAEAGADGGDGDGAGEGKGAVGEQDN